MILFRCRRCSHLVPSFSLPADWLRQPLVHWGVSRENGSLVWGFDLGVYDIRGTLFGSGDPTIWGVYFRVPYHGKSPFSTV